MNSKITNGYFHSPSKGKLTLGGVMKEIANYMSEKPDKFYDVVVGCDSSSGLEPDFPLVIVVLRKGEGGRFFLKKIKYPEKKFYNFRQRILEEVLLSCELALFLREDLGTVISQSSSNLNYEFRYIHADVGENGATRDMIKEISGLIKGNGFEPKIKPEAYVASAVADRYA